MRAITRRRFQGLLAGFMAAPLLAAPARARPLASRKVALVPFDTAPFPYRGKLPDSDVDFLDVNEGGRLGHTSPRGGVYWEDETYSDNRVLLALPKGFDPGGRPGIVVYFHGNGAALERDVLQRQAVVAQIEASQLNVALVAPQFAVNALDSSAGRFWLPGAFSAFMQEAAVRLGSLAGDRHLGSSLRGAPLVLCAYSGGYNPAAFVLANGDEGKRMYGVVLLDALFGEVDKYASWIVRHSRTSFFVSGYSESSAEGNTSLEATLRTRSIATVDGLPRHLGPRVCSFVSAPPDTGHDDFVTKAWVDWPLEDILARAAAA
jgi:hypothetical protein